MSALTLAEMAKALARARQIFEDHQNGTFGGKPVYRATPGCTRMCPRCDIGCAVAVGMVADLERMIDVAVARPRPRTFIITEAGHA